VHDSLESAEDLAKLKAPRVRDVGLVDP
jgi:hypothetical protein